MSEISESAAKLIRDGKPSDAVRLLTAALANSETSELWNDWATAQFGCGNVDQAERGYRRALDLDSSDRQSAVNLGLLFLAQGRLQEGISVLEQHKSTLTEQEQNAIRELATRSQPQVGSESSSATVERRSSERAYTKVLVVVPIHDREEFVIDALRSLKKQTTPPNEIVVTGNPIPVLPDFAEVQVDRTLEPFHTRVNKVIDQSDCDAFILLADDDKLAPTYIERTVAMMERTGVDIVYTPAQFFGGSTAVSLYCEWTDVIEQCNPTPPTALCKKAAWANAGKYQDAQFFDWDLWWRCYQAGATAVRLPDPLFLYRIHAGQNTNLLDMRELNKAKRQYFDMTRSVRMPKASAAISESETIEKTIRDRQQRARLATLERSAQELIASGHPRDACAILASAIATRETAGLWNDWAIAQLSAGLPFRAKLGYRRALRLNPSMIQSAVNLTALLLHQGNFDEAFSLLESHATSLSDDQRDMLRRLVAAEEPSGGLSSTDGQRETLAACGDRESNNYAALLDAFFAVLALIPSVDRNPDTLAKKDRDVPVVYAQYYVTEGCALVDGLPSAVRPRAIERLMARSMEDNRFALLVARHHLNHGDAKKAGAILQGWNPSRPEAPAAAEMLAELQANSRARHIEAESR